MNNQESVPETNGQVDDGIGAPQEHQLTHQDFDLLFGNGNANQKEEDLDQINSSMRKSH